MIRFVLLAHPRTGTTLISNSLVEHPDVILYGELFHRILRYREPEAARSSVGTGIKRTNLGYGLPPCDINEDGFRYLERVYSQEIPCDALGFKLCHHQAMDGPNASTWDFFEEHPEIRIIHITRRNLFEIIVSYERAWSTFMWHSDKSTTTAPFELPVDLCEKNFSVLEAAYDAHIPLLESRPVLNLEYEQIKDNFHECMDRICSFLELKRQKKFTPRLKKIASLLPSEEISNYRELKSHFKDTRYGRYFVW